MKVHIRVGSVRLEARLDKTETARAIYDSLPYEGPFHVWGDEFYFELPVGMDLDNTATKKVAVGDIGYWPPGKAVAIFFGPTPMSYGPEPVPASEVNMIGRITGDATELKKAVEADMISIKRK